MPSSSAQREPTIEYLNCVARQEELDRLWFRQLDLAPFDGLNWPHLKGCDLLFRVGLGGRSPKGDWNQAPRGAVLLA
jgi:hypothetical protein